MNSEKPILYIKPGCPWCIEVQDYLKEQSIPYTEKNVSAAPEAFQEMIDISGQTKAPTLDWNGKILADFGVDELIPFLNS